MCGGWVVVEVVEVGRPWWLWSWGGQVVSIGEQVGGGGSGRGGRGRVAEVVVVVGERAVGELVVVVQVEVDSLG
jgi:hypothetical protein